MKSIRMLLYLLFKTVVMSNVSLKQTDMDAPNTLQLSSVLYDVLCMLYNFTPIIEICDGVLRDSFSSC